MVCRMNSHFKKIKKNCFILSEMCINSIFQRFFPVLLVKKKMPHLLLFLHGLLVYAFSIPGTNFIKKNTHIPLFGYAQKNSDQVTGWSVGWFPCMFVCRSDFCWSCRFFFLRIIFIGNLDY
jgi:hypothetical protein